MVGEPIKYNYILRAENSMSLSSKNLHKIANINRSQKGRHHIIFKENKKLLKKKHIE
jgi:hypothetical protein